MLRVRILGLALVAAFALSVVAASSASAHFFNSTNTTLVLDKGGEQKFTTGGGAEVICSEELSVGEVTAGQQLLTLAIVEYHKCKVGIFSATVSLAHYDFSADELVNLLNTITINVPAGGCHVTVGPQDLKGITYANLAGGKLEIKAKAGGIVSEGSGGACGGKSTTGTYTGNSVVTAEVGEIKWE